jgi:hypothetical protein
MRFTARNIVATVLVAAVVIPYVGYLVWGEMPFIEDPRGMAATGLILGVAAVLVAGRAALESGPMHRAAQVSGAAALALGIAAVWAETSEALLALFIVGIVVTWGLGEVATTREAVTTPRPMAHVS